MATNYGWENKSRTRIYNPKLKRYHRVDANLVPSFENAGWTTDLPQANKRMVIPRQSAPQEQVKTPRKTYEDFNAPQSAIDKRVAEAQNRLMTNLNTYQQGYQGPTLQEIMLQRQQAAQKQIDMLKQSFAPQFQDIREQGADLKQMARSGIVARGQAGSSFAAAPKQEVDKATSESLSAKRNEMQMQISSIMAAAQDRATEEFEASRQRFAEDSQRGLDSARLRLQYEEEEQRIQRDAGKQKLTGLARQGISLDDLAEEDYRGLLTETGLSNLEARALHQSELPAEAKKDVKHQVIGDTVVYHYFDEKSKTIKTFSEKVEGLAEKSDGGYDVQVKGDNLVFIPENVKTTDDVLIKRMGQGEDVTHKLGRYDTLVDADGKVIARGSQGGGGYNTNSSNTNNTSSNNINSRQFPQSTPAETQEIPTFEEFIGEKEEEQMMSLAPEERETYREEFKEMITARKETNKLAERTQKIAGLSLDSQEALKNPDVLTDMTPTNRQEIISEVSGAGISTKDLTNRRKPGLPPTVTNTIISMKSSRDDVKEIYKLLQELEGKTGPVLGRVWSMDMYSVERKALESAIQQAVPGLARGVFKEVGVLTNEDRTAYTQTLANANLTMEQARVLTDNLLNKIDRTIDSYLEGYESANYNIGNMRSYSEEEQQQTKQPTEQQMGSKTGHTKEELDFLRQQGFEAPTGIQ